MVPETFMDKLPDFCEEIIVIPCCIVSHRLL